MSNPMLNNVQNRQNKLTTSGYNDDCAEYQGISAYHHQKFKLPRKTNNLPVAITPELDQLFRSIFAFITKAPKNAGNAGKTREGSAPACADNRYV